MIVVMTKEAVAGEVKTRLVPKLGAEGAAAFHLALVEVTLRMVASLGPPVVVRLDGARGRVAALAAELGFEVLAQRTGDLGERLVEALGDERRVAIGTDAPTIDPQWIADALARPEPVVLGPADDGGYWLVGTARSTPALFASIPWSTPEVHAATLARARAADLAVGILPSSYDIDEPADLVRLAADPRCPPSLRRRARA
jgi:rSAM/selenodomain-associated transferase 1